MNHLDHIFEIIKEKGEAKPFFEHNFETQKALAQWMLIDGDAWYDDIPQKLHDLYYSVGWCDEDWRLVISYLCKKRGDIVYTYAKIPIEIMKNAIMIENNEISKSFKTWNEYHNWYIRRNMPIYNSEKRYPCLIEKSEEIIIDGWHRFHCYAKNNDKEIPIVY